MVGELSLDKSGTSLLDSIVAYFVANAPARAKCVFLNCEMSDSPNDFAISTDVFAVIKPIFGNKIQRVQLEVSWEAADLLISLGRHILGDQSGRYTTIDIIINGRSKYEAYRDNGSLRRLKGGDGMYRSKYEYYVAQNVWLSDLHSLKKIVP
jgi:hypothetical protein